MLLRQGNYCVEFEDIGEGLSGDYNPDDPNDIPLLRFYVSKINDRGFFEAMEDASYCTQVPVDTDDYTQMRLLEIIMDRVYGLDNVKKICEELSWIDPSWVDTVGRG